LAAIVQGSGDPEGFDAAAWSYSRLNSPVPALGGRRPIAPVGSPRRCATRYLSAFVRTSSIARGA